MIGVMENMTSNEQTRADSLADAETLRSNRLLAPYPIWLSLQAAKCAGEIIAYELRADAYEIGKNAARSAFRACPGLRG